MRSIVNSTDEKVVLFPPLDYQPYTIELVNSD